MIDVLAFDKASVRSRNDFGHLRIAHSPISKACVSEYYGHEIPGSDRLGLVDSRKYRLLRDPDELRKAAPTFNGMPLLNIHTPSLSSDHPRENVVGALGTDADFDGTYLTNSMVVWDESAIAGIESGRQRELSSSYGYDVDPTPGVYQGEPYDLRMINIRANHCALVPRGRAGPDVLVGDSQPTELLFMKKHSLKAFAILGALQVAPKLANDAAVDATDLLAGVTDAQLPSLRATLLKRCEGKLAADAIAEVAKQFDLIVAADEGEETEEERKEREAKEKAAKEKSANDEKDEKYDDEDDEDEKKKAKQANDAAIRLAADSEARAVTKAVAETKKAARELREAEKMVLPLVGEVIAMDSADEVYAYALKTKGVDVAGVPAAAYKAMVQMALNSQAAQPLAADHRMANDSAALSDLKKINPQARMPIRG